MRGLRDGFSLMEVMIVVVMLAGLTALSAPRISAIRDSSNMASARQQLTAAIASARAAAVQKGRPALFIRDGNAFRAVVPMGADPEVIVVPRTDLEAEFKVRLTTGGAATDTVRFDSRGLASPRLTDTGIYHLVSSARRDSVCVGIVGQIFPRGCKL